MTWHKKSFVCMCVYIYIYLRINIVKVSLFVCFLVRRSIVKVIAKLPLLYNSLDIYIHTYIHIYIYMYVCIDIVCGFRLFIDFIV